MQKALNVLVAAYACNPFKGSEEGVGWGWVRAMARYHRLSVITAQYHRRDIEKVAARMPKLFARLDFHYVPHKPWHYQPTKGWLFIERSMLKPVMNYAYRLWQRDAYHLANALHGQNPFDLIHQITYVGFRFPGKLWRIDVPFVWGPIGGLENTPWPFLPELGFSGFIYYAGRNIINSLDRRYLPGPKKAFRKARGGIIAATEGIRREILRWYGVDSEVICEIGPPGHVAENYSTRQPGEPLKMAWNGQHLPGKALSLLLKALATLPRNIKWCLDIMGHGECTSKWRKLSAKLGVAKWCHWHGLLPRQAAVELAHKAHIFVITSMKDLTSTVLLEALSQGVPVVCPDHCGFSKVVTSECGIKIAVHTPRQFAADLASAITLLAYDEEYRRKLAKGALRRIEKFSWEEKAKQVDIIYRQIAYT